MEFESKKIILKVNKLANLPFEFKGKAAQDLKDIKVVPSCGCTAATLRVLRGTTWVATTQLKVGENFKVTGTLNKIANGKSTAKKVTVRVPNMADISLLFTMIKI